MLAGTCSRRPVCQEYRRSRSRQNPRDMLFGLFKPMFSQLRENLLDLVARLTGEFEIEYLS